MIIVVVGKRSDGDYYAWGWAAGDTLQQMDFWIMMISYTEEQLVMGRNWCGHS